MENLRTTPYKIVKHVGTGYSKYKKCELQLGTVLKSAETNIHTLSSQDRAATIIATQAALSVVIWMPTPSIIVHEPEVPPSRKEEKTGLS